MDIIVYEIEVTTDVLHGWKSVIPESYIPDLDLYINETTAFLGEATGTPSEYRRVPKEGVVTKRLDDPLAISKFISLKRLLEDKRRVEAHILSVENPLRRAVVDRILQPVRKRIEHRRKTAVPTFTTTSTSTSKKKRKS